MEALLSNQPGLDFYPLGAVCRRARSGKSTSLCIHYRYNSVMLPYRYVICLYKGELQLIEFRHIVENPR